MLILFGLNMFSSKSTGALDDLDIKKNFDFKN